MDILHPLAQVALRGRAPFTIDLHDNTQFLPGVRIPFVISRDGGDFGLSELPWDRISKGRLA